MKDKDKKLLKDKATNSSIETLKIEWVMNSMIGREGRKVLKIGARKEAKEARESSMGTNSKKQISSGNRDNLLVDRMSKNKATLILR